MPGCTDLALKWQVKIDVNWSVAVRCLMNQMPIAPAASCANSRSLPVASTAVLVCSTL